MKVNEVTSSQVTWEYLIRIDGDLVNKKLIEGSLLTIELALLKLTRV